MANQEKLSHKFLCSLAVKWLLRPASRSGPGCMVAVAETANWINQEVPDAIGWRPYNYGGCGSVLVEVKTSRADFLADIKKPHRKNSALGMGTYRYFMAPEGLLKPEDIPAKWGFIEVNSRNHIKVLSGHVFLKYEEEDCWRHECHERAEISTLALVLNRVGDPQKVQERLRMAENHAARMVKRAEDMQRRADTLSGNVTDLRLRVWELEEQLKVLTPASG